MPADATTADNLYEDRVVAAQASRGTSSDKIYDRVLQLAADRQLGGETLDFGAGIGLLARRLAADPRFTHVSGADILPPPDDLPNQITWISADLNGPDALTGRRFDTIFCIETIEHLENPRAVFRSLFYLLKNGGTLVLSTPNCESLRSYLSLVFRGHFSAFTESSYPAHITALLKADLSRVALSAGFQDLSFDYGCPGALPRFTKASWQSVSGGRLKGRLFADNFILVARRWEDSAPR